MEDDGLIDKAEVQEEIEAHQHEEYEEALGTYTFWSNTPLKISINVK